MDSDNAHQSLLATRDQLQSICDSIAFVGQPTPILPIIDLSEDANDLNVRRHPNDSIQGLKVLRESVKREQEVIDKYLASSQKSGKKTNTPSTNAPYLLAVWNVLLSAPPPVVAVGKYFPLEGQELKATKSGSGCKVDIVADNGRQWIRINTTKNSRLLAEFRESDSYLTDSEDEDTDDSFKAEHHELHNSVIENGQSLLTAAKLHAARGNSFPNITMKLSRLHPGQQYLPHLRSLGLKTTASFQDDVETSGNSELRIGKTIEILLKMDIDVELGELPFTCLAAVQKAEPGSQLPSFIPSCRVNLDLTVLIALVSDLSHAPLPSLEEQAFSRFIRDPTSQLMAEEPEGDVQHARALTGQLLQEMRKGLVENLRDQMSLYLTSPGPQKVEFWTTPEARERCIRIVTKIGGPEEKRRVQALFSESLHSEPSDLVNGVGIPEYWDHSRYSAQDLPFLPIRLFDSDRPTSLPSRSHDKDAFFHLLERTCLSLLSNEQNETPSDIQLEFTNIFDNPGDIQRASVTKANPRLTVHTVHSMLWGASLGWTTLTANKASVKAILREMKNVGQIPTRNVDDKQEHQIAAIWLVEPRSLAEGMRVDDV